MSHKDYILKNIDVNEFYQDILEWDGTNNVQCPFLDNHEKGSDDTPSFSINRQTGSVFCHSCDYKASSVVGFYEDYFNVSFKESLFQVHSEYIEKLVSRSIWESAHKTLLKEPEVIYYLKRKRDISLNTIKRFKLGWKNDRLYIPILNAFGFCVDVRKYDLYKKTKIKTLHYQKGYGHARLFPIANLLNKQILLVAGETDCLVANGLGFHAITVTSSENYWNAELNSFFKGKEVVIIPDNDRVGKIGANKKKEALQGVARKVVVVELPVKKEKEDLTDWVVRYGGTKSQLKKMIKQSLRRVKEYKIEDTYSPDQNEDRLFDIITSVTVADQKIAEAAEQVLDKLKKLGKFFRDSDGKYFYASKKSGTLEVAPNNNKFAAFLSMQDSLINSATNRGRFILMHIRNYAYLNSTLVYSGGWTRYLNKTIYIQFKLGEILKITPFKREVLVNSINDDYIKLETPLDSMYFNYKPDVKWRKGLKLLWRNVSRNIACCTNDRLLITCWYICFCLLEYTAAKPIMRFQGSTSTGKSTANRLYNRVLFGRDLLGATASTEAGLYDQARAFPIVTIDNLENRNMKNELAQYLITVATGTSKIKRTKDTDKGTDIADAKSLISTNGIEPLGRAELINRTIEISLDKEKYGRVNFNEVNIFNNIEKHRDTILSGLTKLYALKVLPALAEGKDADYIFAMSKYGSHSKDRFNEFFALMRIILDALCEVIGQGDPQDIYDSWIKTQNKSSDEESEGTDEVIEYLNSLVDLGGRIKSLCKVNNSPTIFIEGTTSQLLTDFRMIAKYTGVKCPWQTAHQLGIRISNVEHFLEKAGWTRVFKKSNGRIKYRYAYKHKKIKKTKKNKV